MKIALDVMGGDFAPRATVAGALMAVRELGLEIVLVGPSDVIERELAVHKANHAALSVVHASQVVTMDDSPVDSVVEKPDSSLHRCFDLVRHGEADAMVSAGNSGAMLATGVAILGSLQGVERPAIATPIPSGDDFALLLDAGANVEPKPLHLAQFALMGSVYWQNVRQTESPRVAILANGEESSKGTELTRAAAALLREMGDRINFRGYVEGRDLNAAKVDVVVTDGFTGNVALKTMEGFADFAFSQLRAVFGASLRGRLAYLLIRKRLREMRMRFDKTEYGGAPLLGLNGIAVVAHGSSNARAIRNALRAASNEKLVHSVNPQIVELVAQLPTAMPARTGGKGLRALLNRMRERLKTGHREDAESGHQASKNVDGARHHPDRAAIHAAGRTSHDGLDGSSPPPPKPVRAGEDTASEPALLRKDTTNAPLPNGTGASSAEDEHTQGSSRREESGKDSRRHQEATKTS